MSSTLVAPVADTTSPFSGAFLLQDGADLAKAIRSGDWVSGGIAAFSSVLDTTAALIDPIGTLVANGLGWLIDHIEPLKTWMDELTGNADEVAAFSRTWSNVAQRMHEVGATLQSRLGDIRTQSGATADAYRAYASDLGTHLAAMGEWSGSVAGGLELASQLVRVVHDLVRDAISQVVGMAVSAATELVVSVGTAAPAVLGQITARVSALATRVGETITRLIESVKALAPLLQSFERLGARAAELLSKLLPGGTKVAREADGTFYSVAYEMTLDGKDWAKTRSVHFNRANASLDEAMRADPEFAKAMESMSPGIGERVAKAGGRDNPDPADFIWHHAHPDTVGGRYGVMQLVPTPQHTPGSMFWDVLHPGGRGGFSIWGKKK